MAKLKGYIEFILDSVRNRGNCIDRSKLSSYIKQNIGKEMYRSFYVFEKPFKDSPKNYLGNYMTDYIILDIDSHDKLRPVVQKLNELIGEEKYLPYFSGRGFHILFHSDMFGFEPSPSLPAVVKATIKSLFPEADPSIYSKSAIYRLPHSINQKTGLYKIPLYKNELWDLDYIRSIAKQPRHNDFDYSSVNIVGDGRLSEFIIESEPVSIRAAFEPVRIATCIHTIYGSNPIKGKRHVSVLVLASHFRRHGIPFEATYNALWQWLQKNPDGFPEEEFRSIVEKVYQVGYTYSCNHPLLKQHCSPQCIYFKGKSLAREVLTVDDVHATFKDKINQDFTGRTLNFDELLDMSSDARAYPGELVTLFGLPGAGKTAIAQLLALGMDIKGNIESENQLPVLYISMEMSAELMYRRWAQMVLNMNKEQVLNYFKNIVNGKPLPEMSNILLRVVSPSLTIIREEVKKYQPRLLVVDYIELLDIEAASERGRIKTITRFLKQLALNEDIIVLAISQVSRIYSRAGILDLYAGKESSSIEADSDKVIGLWGANNQKEKKIEFFKNRDGDTLDVQYVMMTDSFRFMKISEKEYKRAEAKNKSPFIANTNGGFLR